MLLIWSFDFQSSQTHSQRGLFASRQCPRVIVVDNLERKTVPVPTNININSQLFALLTPDIALNGQCFEVSESKRRLCSQGKHEDNQLWQIFVRRSWLDSG